MGLLFNDKYRSNLPRIIITTTHRSKTKQTCRLKERERFYCILASSNQTLVDSKASLRRTCRKRFRSRRNTRVVTHLFSHCKTRTGSKKPTTLRLCILIPTKSRSTDGWKIIKTLNYQN